MVVGPVDDGKGDRKFDASQYPFRGKKKPDIIIRLLFYPIKTIS